MKTNELINTTPHATLDGYIGEPQQMEIIKYLLTNKELLTRTDQNIFTCAEFRQIIGRTKDYVNKYDELPTPTTLKDLLTTQDKIGNEVMYGILTTLEGMEVKPYTKDKYLKFLQQQNIIKLANTLLNNATKGELTTRPIEEFKPINLNEKNIIKPISLFDGIEDYLTYKREVIPTYHEELDKHLNGGLEKGAITLLLGGTGIGKTTITTHLCNKIALKGHNVLQIVFEDNIHTIRNKHFAKIVNKNVKYIDEHKKEVIEFLQMNYPTECNALNEHLRIVRLPNNQMTIKEIEEYIKKVNKEFPIDLISLDYLSCLKHTKDFQPPHIEEGEMVRDLERMANEMNIVLILAEQLNRSGNGTDATMMNVQGSISKAQDANTIILLSRTQEQQQESKADLSIEKCRNGFGYKKWENITFDNGTLTLDLTTAENNDIKFK